MSGKQSFTDFKVDFYDKVKDFSIFDCAEFNALKIVVDGIRVDYISRGPVKSPIFGSLLKYALEQRLKRIKATFKGGKKYQQKEFDAFKNRKYVISDDGRVALDAVGVPHSYYFTALMQSLNKNDCLHVIDKKRNDKATCDLNYELLINTFLLQPLNAGEKQLIMDIRKTYHQISKSGIFSAKDLENIGFAFQNFFNKYKVWSRLLEQLSPQCMFTIVHYHNEGKTLAFKRKGIQVIELQHGLIASTDVFYIFPKQTQNIIQKALFADEIWVYGNYWKKVLELGVEYLNKIKIAGYYLYDNFSGYDAAEEEIEAFAGGKKLIIITTQTTMHKPFIEYTLWLAKDIETRNLPYKIIVKTHPLEKQEHYAILNETKGVKVFNYPLPILFKKVQLHVSIYSTTLFDGARAKVPGFSLFNEQYKDYVAEIIKSGVAYPLLQNQNPIDLMGKLEVMDASYYYSEFKINGLMRL
jgi:hypothetical protein